MKAAVIVFPGSNCDRDVKVALEASMGAPAAMVWHGDTVIPAVDLVVIPGGFSYGDYLRSGAMAAHSPIMGEVIGAARRGVPILAICNGFQIVAEAGLLPGVLMANAGLRFVCRDVHLKVETSRSVFTLGYAAGQVVRFPVAHHDGNFFADDDALAAIEDGGQVAFRYCDADGLPGGAANPNGSRADIAGLFNARKTILGLMPHPERLSDPRLGGDDGKTMFDGLVRALS